MLDFTWINQLPVYLEAINSLRKRHDQNCENLANVDKAEQILEQKKMLVEKDQILITLLTYLQSIQTNQEFEKKIQEFELEGNTGLYKDKDGKKYCSKCISEKRLQQVYQLDSRYPDQVRCPVCERSYEDVIELGKRREDRAKRAKALRPNLF